MCVHTHHRRTAFTLVEMLVAAALIIFMMWIIASAFEKGLESFRVLKTAGDMQEKLRSAATAIRRDLTRPHFEKVESESWGGENLSDQRLDQSNWQPPANGYFRIYQQGQQLPPTSNPPPPNYDGPDSDDQTMPHYRAPETANSLGHVLQFTTKLKGIRRDQYYMIDTQDKGADSALTNPNGIGDGRLHRFNFPVYNRRVRYPIAATTGLPSTYSSGEEDPNLNSRSSVFTTVWAEVTYFLRANGEFTGPGIPLYNLYRRQTLLVTGLGETVTYNSGTSPRPLEIDANNPNYFEISAWRNSSTVVPVNSENMVTAPCRRFGVNANSPVGAFQSPIPRLFDQIAGVGGTVDHPMTASDLLLTDVTDFEIKARWEPSGPQGSFAAPPAPREIDTVTSLPNPDYPFDRLPVGNNTALADRVFDTWSRRVNAGQPDDYGTLNTSVTPPVAPWNQGYVTTTPATMAGNKTIPLKVRIRALQIELRIWDVKSKQSRQITIIQDV